MMTETESEQSEDPASLVLVSVLDLMRKLLVFTTFCDTQPRACLQSALRVVHRSKSRQFARMHKRNNHVSGWKDKHLLSNIKKLDINRCFWGGLLQPKIPNFMAAFQKRFIKYQRQLVPD